MCAKRASGCHIFTGRGWGCAEPLPHSASPIYCSLSNQCCCGSRGEEVLSCWTAEWADGGFVPMGLLLPSHPSHPSRGPSILCTLRGRKIGRMLPQGLCPWGGVGWNGHLQPDMSEVCLSPGLQSPSWTSLPISGPARGWEMVSRPAEFSSGNIS